MKALIQHYGNVHTDVGSLYAAVVTDIQVRASTRAFVYCLVAGGVPMSRPAMAVPRNAGGVPMKDILRYRISLPIKEADKLLPPERMELFKGKVPHSFDFMHWWYFP